MNTITITFDNLQGRSWILSDDQGTPTRSITDTGTIEYGEYDPSITTVTLFLTAQGDAECEDSKIVTFDCPE